MKTRWDSEMKFNCDCGYTIRYQTDYLPYKANFIPDQDWFAMLNMISVLLTTRAKTEHLQVRK